MGILQSLGIKKQENVQPVNPNPMDLFAEISFYKSPYYSQSYQVYNPDDLVSKKGSLEIYEQMRRDDQVKAVLTMKKRSILSTGFKIQPASEEKIDIEIAKFIEFCLYENLKGSFEDSIYEVLSALDFGFSVTEKIYKVIDRGEYANKTGLYCLKTRAPHSFDFELDDYGYIKKLIQHGPNGDTILPADKFIHYVYNSEFGNPYGNSDLRAAYRSWFSKDIIIKFWNIFLERFGMPIATAKVPANMKKEDKARIDNILKNLQSKTSIRYPNDIELGLLEATRAGTAGYETAIEKHNIMIARSMLVPDLLGYSGNNGGAYNLGEKQHDLFSRILNELRRQIEECIVNEQIIKQLVDLNYQTNIYPEFIFNPLSEENKKEIITQWITAVDKGVVVNQLSDEEYIRESLSFPKKENTDVAVKKEPKAPIFTHEKHFRAPNNYEKKIDFKQVESELNETETKTIDKLEPLIVAIEDTLINKIRTKKIIENNDLKAIGELDLSYIGDIRLLFKDVLQKTYYNGQRRAKTSIKEFVAVSNIDKLPPTKALQYFNEKSMYIAGALRDKILTDTKAILFQGLKQGQTNQEIIFNIQKMFIPYVEGGVLPGEQIAPWRVETIVRTNLSDAYNMGMLDEYNDNDEVVAYQWSAILDGRTSEYCESMDGRIFDKGNPDFKFPPAHYNCRSIVIPILKDEDYKLDKMPKIERAEGF